MNRLSLLALLLALLPTAFLPSPVQAADDDAPDLVVPEQFATFFYRNDDEFTAMLDMEIDSIMFAFNDLDYHRYPYAVRQVIYCGDSILSIPLEAIDSIGFVTPPVKINPEVFLVDAEINKYVTAVDSLSFCMSKLAPRFPTEGQVVMTTCYEGVLEELGACGRVSKIRSIGDTYKFELDFTDLSPIDFFDQLITANLSLVQEEEGGDVKKILFTSASAQNEGSGGETNTDKRSAAQVFADKIKNTFIGKYFKWGDSSIFSEDGWWIEYHGFNHYDPKDCEDLDSYDGGKYMSYGFTPKLTLKFNIVTNIQKVLDWIEGAEEYVASTNEYIKLGAYVGLDLTLFAKFGFKTSVGDVKDDEMVAVKREEYERMLKEYKKIFPEGKKMKSSFKCMDGIHVRLIPTVPVLDLHIVPLAPAFSEYQKQPKEKRGDLEDIFIPNSRALDVDLSANANFWFEVGAELQKINGKWEKNFFKDYGCDFGGKISVEGSFDLFAGIAPSIGLGIVDARIVELALVGNLGGYIKGNISAGLSTSTANKSILDFTEPMSPDDIAEVTRRYDTYYGPDKSRLSTGIRIGLTPNISIGKGIPGFDPILDEPIPLPKFGDENSMIAEGLRDISEGIDFEILSLGLLPMAKDIEVTPNIPDLRDPTSYTYNISYKTYGNTIKNYSMGLLVMDCAEPQKRYVQWSEKELLFFSGLTKYMTQDFEFNMAGLEAGKVYAAFPVVWLFGDPKAYSKDMFDRITMLGSKFDWLAVPMSPSTTFRTTIYMSPGDVNTLEMVPNSDGNRNYVNYNNVIAGYTDGSQMVGIAYVDAGQLEELDPDGFAIHETMAHKLTYVAYNKATRLAMANGEHTMTASENDLPDLKLPNLHDGHRYYYALFHSSMNEEDFAKWVGSGCDLSKEHDIAFSATKQLFTEGFGFSIKASQPIDLGEDFICPVGCMTWSDAQNMDKSKLMVKVLYRQAGASDWESRNILGSDIKNGYEFKMNIDGLKKNTLYEYCFEASYDDGVGYNSFSETSNIISNIKTATPELVPAIDNFECALVGTTNKTAKFEMRADWKPTESDVVEMGILYYRNTKPGSNILSRLTLDSNLDRQECHAMTYGKQKEKVENYADKRGEIVTVTLTGLSSHRPNNPDKRYFYRPYFVIYNDNTRNKNMSEIGDNYNDIIDFKDSKNKPHQKLVVYGKVFFDGSWRDYGEFDTEVSTQGSYQTHAISKPEKINGSFWYHTTPIGLSDMARSGVLLSNGDDAKLIDGSTGVITIDAKHSNTDPYKDKIMRKIRRSAEEDEEMDEEDIELAAMLTEPLVAKDLSKLKIGETYRYRAFYEANDGTLIYTDTQELLYDGAVDPDPKPDPEPDPTEYVAGEAVDLGYVDDNGKPGPLWSSLNLGATKVGDFGKYYAWGDITPKEEYDEDTYTWPFKDFEGEQHISNTVNDAAHVRLADGWRLPTADEFRTLLEKCDVSYVQLVGGAHCLCITSPTNGNVIYLPASGNMYGTHLFSGHEGGCYWTGDCPKFEEALEMGNIKDDKGNIDVEKATLFRDAYRLHFNWVDQTKEVAPARVFFGRSIRPVKDKK